MKETYRWLASALTCMAVLSCGKDVNYDMTDAARAAMDRIVGVYVLEGAEWDGGSIDLDGDGVASESIYDELVKIPEMEETGVVIDMRQPYEVVARISVAVEEIYTSGDNVDALWNERTFTPLFGIEPSGEYDLRIDSDYGMSSEPDYWREACFQAMAVEVTGEDGLSLSADTAFLDNKTSEIRRGRITYRFKCISGKGRK